jgi:N-acetylmuramoyl-L-alanine amidase
MDFIPHPSPNFGERRGYTAPDLVVLHYTAMKSPEEALERLSSAVFEVSAHYLVAEDGRIFRMIDEAHRAWHAGAGAWGDVTDVNSASIGIELCNTGFAPFAARMMDALEGLLADILARHAIPPERVIAHSDCAPGRKIDPGRRFDWRRLALSGLSVWPEPGRAEPGPMQFAANLRTIGYSPDASPEMLLSAFRLRFRPGATGPLEAEDMAAAEDLARRYPVDRKHVTS